ncbi:hypothetical protein V8E54_001708 [Elaphomyces granulatus]
MKSLPSRTTRRKLTLITYHHLLVYIRNCITFKGRGIEITTTKIAKTYRSAMTVCGLVCVYYRGRFAAAKRITSSCPQGDGEFEGMGVLRFLWKPGNIERLREGFQFPASADLLNNIAQATAENYVTIKLELSFATFGWCDWAYIVDLDRNTFDVFGGEEEKREAPITTRFSDLGGDGDRTVPALLQSFPFSRLPATEKEFERALETRMREDRCYWGRLESFSRSGNLHNN